MTHYYVLAQNINQYISWLHKMRHDPAICTHVATLVEMPRTVDVISGEAKLIALPLWREGKTEEMIDIAEELLTAPTMESSYASSSGD